MSEPAPKDPPTGPDLGPGLVDPRTIQPGPDLADLPEVQPLPVDPDPEPEPDDRRPIPGPDATGLVDPRQEVPGPAEP